MPLLLLNPRCSSRSTNEITPLVRLWLLRLLVPINLHSSLIQKEDFSNDLIAEKIGLTEQSDVSKEGYNPKELRAKLRKLHQEAERDLISAKPPEYLVKNMAKLRGLVNLSETDCRIVEFTVMLRTDSFFKRRRIGSAK